MPKRWNLVRLLAFLSCGATLLVNGCMANLERNLDMILSPSASENLLLLPYSSVINIALFFERLRH
jgi:hypothetical protein